jgi:hypothetical protein
MFKHLHETKMGYFQHLVFAWKFGLRCLFASLAAFLHGAFPFIWETKSSEIVLDLGKLISKHKD